mgnify:CR=1 FL=1
MANSTTAADDVADQYRLRLRNGGPYGHECDENQREEDVFHARVLHVLAVPSPVEGPQHRVEQGRAKSGQSPTRYPVGISVYECAQIGQESRRSMYTNRPVYVEHRTHFSEKKFSVGVCHPAVFWDIWFFTSHEGTETGRWPVWFQQKKRKVPGTYRFLCLGVRKIFRST